MIAIHRDVVGKYLSYTLTICASSFPWTLIENDIRSYCDHVARIKRLFVDSKKASKEAEKDLLEDRF